MRMKKIIICLLILMVTALMSTACGRDNDKVKTYGNDGYLGLTNANPNFPLSPGYHNYRNDSQLIKQTLSGIQEVETYTVNINGGDLYIKLGIPDGYSRAEIETIEQNVYKQLTYMLPRYTIHLTSDKSNMDRNEQVD
ncbi:hypothetical protein MALU111345_03425 [Marinicrinis lubricantis]